MTEPIHSDLDQLNLPIRTYNALRRHGVHAIDDVLRLGRRYFETPGRGIGQVGRELIAHALWEKGLQWVDEGPPRLPELSPTAAQVVEALGLGDSLGIRRGLAKVLKDVLVEAEGLYGRMEIRHAVAELERGTQ